MSARLRLDLIVRTYPDLHIGEGEDPDMTWSSVARWTWQLWAGSRIVSSSGSQLYSRRADCVRGAEVGAGIESLGELLSISRGLTGVIGTCYRFTSDGSEGVRVTIFDERSP